MENKDDSYDLVFYANRSTPQVVPKGADAKSKKGYGEQTYRRPANEEELKKIRKGEWVRVDQSGNKPSSPDYKKTKYRPGLLKKKSNLSLLALLKSAETNNDLKDSCWKGYRAEGLKRKGSRMVPNCVPVKPKESEKSASIPAAVRQAMKSGDKALLKELGRRGGLAAAKAKTVPKTKEETFLETLQRLHRSHASQDSVKHVNSHLKSGFVQPYRFKSNGL